MNESALIHPNLLVGLFVFVAFVLAAEGAYLLWRSHRGPDASRRRRRLTALSQPSSQRVGILKTRLTREWPWVQAWLEHLSHVRLLEKTLLQSGLDWSVSRVLATSGTLAALTGLVVRLAVGDWLITLAAALASGLAPLGYILFRRARRLHRIEHQLPDALDLMARALRAGHAFGASLKIAGEEAQDPIATELQMVHEEVNFGVSLEDALEHLSDRVPLGSVRYFMVAVMVQRDAGGNLAEILGNLSRLLRNREKLLDKVQVLSAEGRMSGWILLVLPFVLGGLLYLLNPKFMAPLFTDPIGIAMLKYLLAMMVAGAVIMRRIIRFHV